MPDLENTRSQSTLHADPSRLRHAVLSRSNSSAIGRPSTPPVLSKLQSRWISKGAGLRPMLRHSNSTPSLSAAALAKDSPPSDAPGRRQSVGSVSDDSLESSDEGSEATQARSTEDAGSDITDPTDYVPSVTDTNVQSEHSDEEVIRSSKIHDFGLESTSPSLSPSRIGSPAPPLPERDPKRWADRMRSRSSQGMLSPSASTPNLSTMALPSPPLFSRFDSSKGKSSNGPLSPLSPSFAQSSNGPLSPLSPSFAQSQDGSIEVRRSRPRKSISEAIDFDRIKSSVPRHAQALQQPALLEVPPTADDGSSITAVQSAADSESVGESYARGAQSYQNVSIRDEDDDADSLNEDNSIYHELDEYEFEFESPPEVPPALEYVDPEIPCVEPSASTATLPLADQKLLEEPALHEHPWTVPPFNLVERDQPRIRKYRATFKIAISLAVVISLLVGYGMRLRIVTYGPWSFGMYGLLLVLDFTVQTIAASFNRRHVNKMTPKSAIVKGVAQRAAAGAADEGVPLTELPKCSIAVVGYREDEEAWLACLKSLQAQEYPIKHIIGVVDGNDQPDLDMANAFGKAFPEDERLIVHLPVLLSVMYKEKYHEVLNSLGHPPLTRWQQFKMWLTQEPRPGQAEAHEVAWNYMLNYLHAKATAERWSDWKGICFSQPHGHKRHAMFTAFVVGAYALDTKDAMLTTDSDTYVYPDAVMNMMALLYSDSRYGGVTGDVRIWNKKDSFLALMSSVRYWFAFNVERACQSAFGCVGCLSGPLGLYRTSDLMDVLGPWILQSFLGKETTFGDDRHLTNRILSLGHKTGYTHLARCDSDTPAGYVRWVKQQTRWSKSFFREAFWFPKSFAYHKFWLTVETTKQFLYPMVLTATVLRMLYTPTTWLRPVIWLSTMFGVALIKSVYGVICLRDPTMFLFGFYGVMYFFGLLPSKLFACFTVHITNWGTSARSKSEFARPESFLSRATHVGHLIAWYMALSTGLGYFLATIFHQPYFWLIAVGGLVPSIHAYSDVITGEAKYFMYVLRKKMRSRAAAKSKGNDIEMAVGSNKKRRALLKRMRRGKKATTAAMPVVDGDVASIDASSTLASGTREPSLDQSITTAESIFDASLEAEDARRASGPIIKVVDTSASAEPAKTHLAVRKAVPTHLLSEVDSRKPSLVSLRTTASTASSFDSRPTTPEPLTRLPYLPKYIITPDAPQASSDSLVDPVEKVITQKKSPRAPAFARLAQPPDAIV
ncbi:glycosyltransferase family 2 protein [Gelatoporia subvermispora B]|uniref:Glycosyltransferase family 2 protein n=1 Tax=Ceriporiopsis subvermispora (strain B) TaxID=914234 RepID=M2QDK4_CERS8|nr:glycosyltransferase family 2 protein [Gelatoporia subvermispora B]